MKIYSNFTAVKPWLRRFLFLFIGFAMGWGSAMLFSKYDKQNYQGEARLLVDDALKPIKLVCEFRDRNSNQILYTLDYMWKWEMDGYSRLGSDKVEKTLSNSISIDEYSGTSFSPEFETIEVYGRKVRSAEIASKPFNSSEKP